MSVKRVILHKVNSIHTVRYWAMKKENSKLDWNILRNFKAVFLVYLLVLILSMIAYASTVKLPSLSDTLLASSQTPWGVITSIFTHLESQHLIVNMVAFLVFLILFAIINILFAQEERMRRERFLLLNIFVSAILSNLLWIILVPNVNATGASGLVYASEGVILGFALLNSLKLKDIQKCRLEKRKLVLAIHIFNVIVFLGVFLQIVLAPRVFLNIGPGVNVFVHGIAFYISFVSTLVTQWHKRT